MQATRQVPALSWSMIKTHSQISPLEEATIYSVISFNKFLLRCSWSEAHMSNHVWRHASGHTGRRGLLFAQLQKLLSFKDRFGHLCQILGMHKNSPDYFYLITLMWTYETKTVWSGHIILSCQCKNSVRWFCNNVVLRTCWFCVDIRAVLSEIAPFGHFSYLNAMSMLF